MCRTYHGCSSSQSLKKSNSKRSIAAPAAAAAAAAAAAPAAPAAAAGAAVGAVGSGVGVGGLKSKSWCYVVLHGATEYSV